MYSPMVEFSYLTIKTRVKAGGIIGRATSATLRIDDSSVSEAHALLTYRGAQLRLQALRGELVVDGVKREEISPCEGQEIWLSPTIAVRVEQVVLPTFMVALGIDRQVCAVPVLPCYLVAVGDSVQPGVVLHTWPEFLLTGETRRDALLTLWEDGENLRIMVAGEPPTDFQPPWTRALQGHEVQLMRIPYRDTADTTGKKSNRAGPLRISVRYDTVHVWNGSPAPLVLAGIPARIVSELFLVGMGPVGWDVVAGEIWPQREPDRLTLRDNWDKALQRLRRQLRLHGVRDDLVRIDRHGNVEIVLHTGDQITNDTGEKAEQA